MRSNGIKVFLSLIEKVICENVPLVRVNMNNGTNSVINVKIPLQCMPFISWFKMENF